MPYFEIIHNVLLFLIIVFIIKIIIKLLNTYEDKASNNLKRHYK